MSCMNQSSTQICRLCLAKTKICFNILENSTISQMLESLTSMKILPTDEISTKICLKCRLNLNLAYSIQQNMLKAEKRFHEQAIKIEHDANCIKIEEILLEDSTPDNKFEKQNFVRIDVAAFAREFPNKKSKIDETNVFSRKTYTCEICARVYRTREQLTKHKPLHIRKKCPICGKEVTAPNLKHHLDTHNNNPHICELCGAIFKGKSNLKQHLNYLHNSTRHKCEICDRDFKKRSYLEIHNAKEHGGEPTYVCDTCGKRFYTSNHLNIHVKRTHLKLKLHVCEFCNCKFSSSYSLKTHRRQHTNETPFRCDVCGDGFRQKVSLKTHLKSKHEIVEEETCQCKVCGKGFASKSALDSHMRIH